jgi:hypothetical protein
MNSDKVSVTSYLCGGLRLVRVTAHGILFSFDGASAPIDDWTALLLVALGVRATAKPVKLYDDEHKTNTFLKVSDNQLTLGVLQGAGDVGKLSMEIDLPSSTTVDLLTQVIKELAKYQVKPASE